MHIAIDLQACQSGSRFRGIGRYSLSLAKSLLHEAAIRNHKVTVVLSENLIENSENLLLSLSGACADFSIVTFRVPTPCEGQNAINEWRHNAAEVLREHFLMQLNPDFVHVSTMISDCWSDESIASVGKYYGIPTALTHYDLIPLAMHNEYLPRGPYRSQYFKKLESVKRADLLLAISEHTRKEAIELLNLDADRVVNISSAVENSFGKVETTQKKQAEVMSNYGLRKDFLLYVPGGFDPRKNINRLIEAYASLPPELRARHQLVIASKLGEGQLESWIWKGADAGLEPGELVLTDYVPDEDLIELYRACHTYVFPSLHEGFGLPVLEAMACGAAVIASNCTGIHEAVGQQEALFDPLSVEDIAHRLEQALTDKAYLARLHAQGPIQLAKFSWVKTARIALNAMEAAHAKAQEGPPTHVRLSSAATAQDLLDILHQSGISTKPTPDDLVQFRVCFKKNISALKK